jgi:hypothetical protein
LPERATHSTAKKRDGICGPATHFTQQQRTYQIARAGPNPQNQDETQANAGATNPF